MKTLARLELFCHKFMMFVCAEMMRDQDVVMEKAMKAKTRALARHLRIPVEDFDNIAEVSQTMT